MLNFFSSSLFSNILTIIGIIISLLPQKSKIQIDNSTNYYFENNKQKNSNEDTIFIILLGLIMLLITYILYAIFQSYFTIILVIIYIATVLRYRKLNIPIRDKMLIPSILIITSSFIPYFLPKEVTNFWNNAYKFNLNNIDGISKITTQLKQPINELTTLLSTITSNQLSVAILANMIFVIIISVSFLSDLTRPKKYIRVPKLSDFIGFFISFFIVISFMFYTNPHSPARIIIDKFTHFMSN